MLKISTPMGSDDKPLPVGGVIWDLTKIVAVASFTAALIKLVLKRG